jgi:hypothetical protein
VEWDSYTTLAPAMLSGRLAGHYLSLFFLTLEMNRPILAVLPLGSMSVPAKIAKGGYIIPLYEANGGKFPKTYAYTPADI